MLHQRTIRIFGITYTTCWDHKGNSSWFDFVVSLGWVKRKVSVVGQGPDRGEGEGEGVNKSEVHPDRRVRVR